ncbi:4-hydroxyphenylacetate 3-hydroxylase N-terminal domain-containing protein [Neobacillus sp. 179-J 1A1 HS]|uniref:4-hydroxyphenylacetate 3-hydroxylase family protein n=1 Tax=Neobacillus driksii TaxID=3035913 RepID=UPI0035BC3017
MVRTGKEYLESIRDDRSIYIGGKKVDDVTTHPAFKGITQTIANLYDIASDEKNKMIYNTEDGTLANKIYMIPKSREDLRDRREAIKTWSDSTYGFVGRSPDHVASFFAGFASSPEVFERGLPELKDNAVNFYKFARDNDLYLSYVIIPPQIDRSKASHEQEEKFLATGVYEEREDGIVIRGSQMLGTGAAVSNYLFVSCITPLHPGDETYAVSFVVPMGAPGLKLYPRPSYAVDKPSTFDYPLSTRFDESDALVVFEDVFIPWEHVFIYKDINLVRAQFQDTPAHKLGNSQAQTRFTSKLKFIIGLAKKIAAANGIDKIPAVQEKLAELASLAATAEGMLLASEYECTIDKNGTAVPNPRFLYGIMAMQGELYPKVIAIFRELVGGGVLQVPSSFEDLLNPETKPDMERYIRSATVNYEEKVQLFKLAWDVIGSEFGGRHQQYEMFYAGAPFVAKGYCYRNYGYQEAEALAEKCLNSYSIPKELV